MKRIFFPTLVVLFLSGTTFASDAKQLKKNIDCSKNSVANLKVLVDKNELSKGENQLPVFAKRSFAKMFDGYTIKQTIRFTENDEEGFYISAENEKESLIIKIDSELQISIFKKIKK